MRRFISVYENENEERFNFPLINRELDRSLVDYIVESSKSLEVVEHIKFVGYDYVDDEKLIDLSEYNASTRKKKSKKVKKKEVEYKYRSMQDSRYGELTLKFELNLHGKTQLLEKKLIIPIADENGNYTLNGKKYILIFQLVDASTYTTAKHLTLKSSQAISMSRASREFDDTTGLRHRAPIYLLVNGKRQINIISYFLAKMGVDATLAFFNVGQVISFVPTTIDEDNYVYFPINSKLFIQAPKALFLKHQYLQSIIFMLLDVMSNRTKYDTLNNITVWIEKLGSFFGSGNTQSNDNYRRGETSMHYFERLLDETTQNILKLHDVNKSDIYSITRWLIQNYNELRQKNNMDLKNKRLRGNEYVAAMLTQEYSNRLRQLSRSSSKRVSMKMLENVFKFPGNIIVEKLHQSGLLRFDDQINDMTFFSKLRYTTKGPNAHGGKNPKNVSNRFKSIDPSFIGRLDLNVSGSSDPGLSGVITPFAKTKGMYFDDAHEPEDGIFDFVKDSIQFFTQYGGDPEDVYVNAFQSVESYEDMVKLEENLTSGRNITIKTTRTNTTP